MGNVPLCYSIDSVQNRVVIKPLRQETLFQIFDGQRPFASAAGGTDRHKLKIRWKFSAKLIVWKNFQNFVFAASERTLVLLECGRVGMRGFCWSVGKNIKNGD